MNPIKVKLEWQELKEDDITDIKKFDKYLSELLSQDKVSPSNYELIIEYIFGRAYLAEFFALKLKSLSSSKAKNKQRILVLINKMILERESEKKQVIVQHLEKYLCQIFVSIFDEYKKDEKTIDKFKIMRLCWVTKIQDKTVEDIRKEIGNNYFTDIDIGLSRESLDQIKKYYENHRIDQNVYLKRAIEDLESKERSQPPPQPPIQQVQQGGIEKKQATLVEKPKKKSLPPYTQAPPQIPQKQPEKPPPIQQGNQLSLEEKKKQPLLKMRKNSNNPESGGIIQQTGLSQPNKSSGMDGQINMTNTNFPSHFQTNNTISQQNNKKEEFHNEGDIQIKKKPKKPIQSTVVGISGHVHISPQSHQKSGSSMTQQKPPTEAINGSTPQKKVKTSQNSSGQQSSSQKDESSSYNPASIRPNSSQQQPQAYPSQQNPANNQQKPLRLTEKAIQEKVKKVNEESKNLKTTTGLLLMPTTQSLGYGMSSFSEPQVPQPPLQQQQLPTFSSNQGLSMPMQDNNAPYVPGNPNLLNTNLPPPLPPLLNQNQGQQMMQKNLQPIDLKQTGPLPQNNILNQLPPPPPVPQHQFGSSEYGLNNSQQKQMMMNKQQQQQQPLLPPQNLNYQNNMNQPPLQDQMNSIQNPPMLNQNINNPSNIQRPQDFSLQSQQQQQQQQQQQNQPMFMNQRVTSGPLENQTINPNMRNKFPAGSGMPFSQPPPPPNAPLSQLIDNQNPFQVPMEIEGPNQNNQNMVRRQQQPPFNQMIQPPPPPPQMHQQNMQNLNGNRTPQGSSQNLSTSGQIEQISQPSHIIPPYQQPPPPPGLPMRQMSQSAYNLIGIQQDKTSLFYELFNFIKPTLNSKQYFLSQIEEMKQKKITFIQPQLFLNRNEEIVSISRSSIYDSLPYQCAQCGIRFSARDDLRTHLEDHTIKNLKIIEIKREKEKEKKYRQMFYDANQWIDCQDEDIEKEQETEFESEKNYFVPQNKSNGKCDLCQEPFILTWSDENEDWVYENAKRFEIFETSTGINQVATVHLTCYKVLEKQSEIENSSNEEQVESTERLLN